MKLAKRIVALAIVLCTVAAMMIPGVSAASNDLKVDFKADFTAAGWEAKMMNITNKGVLTTDEAILAVEKNVYDKYSTNGWRLYHGADNKLLITSYKTAIQSNLGSLHVCAQKGKSAYQAVEFKAPASGSYTLTVSFERSSDNANLVHGGYIVPAAASGKYTAETLPKTGSAKVSVTGLTDFVETGTAPATVKTSTDTVDLEAGKEYLAVFFVDVPANATQTTQYTNIAGFSLNYAGAATGSGTGGSQSPNTGIADMQMWFALMTVSCLGLAAMFVYKKKEA